MAQVSTGVLILLTGMQLEGPKRSKIRPQPIDSVLPVSHRFLEI